MTVGNNEMAQFEYVSNNLTSDVDEFSVGMQRGVICQLCHSIELKLTA